MSTSTMKTRSSVKSALVSGKATVSKVTKKAKNSEKYVTAYALLASTALSEVQIKSALKHNGLVGNEKFLKPAFVCSSYTTKKEKCTKPKTENSEYCATHKDEPILTPEGNKEQCVGRVIDSKSKKEKQCSYAAKDEVVNAGYIMCDRCYKTMVRRAEKAKKDAEDKAAGKGKDGKIMCEAGHPGSEYAFVSGKICAYAANTLIVEKHGVPLCKTHFGPYQTKIKAALLKNKKENEEENEVSGSENDSESGNEIDSDDGVYSDGVYSEIEVEQ